MIRESKPPGDYIMNFYRPKYIMCKKTESGKHTRCSRGRGRALHPRGALVSFPDCYLFFYFSKYSKTAKYCLKNCFRVGLCRGTNPRAPMGPADRVPFGSAGAEVGQRADRGEAHERFTQVQAAWMRKTLLLLCGLVLISSSGAWSAIVHTSR